MLSAAVLQTCCTRSCHHIYINVLCTWKSPKIHLILLFRSKTSAGLSDLMSESRRRSARKREDKSYVECPDIVIGTLPTTPSQLLASLSDPDPDWLRIQSGQRIRFRNPDPDSGGLKLRIRNTAHSYQSFCRCVFSTLLLSPSYKDTLLRSH